MKLLEETLRQQWKKAMIEKLGYPPGLLSTERGVGGGGNRRFDLLAFYKKKEELLPLLLIEFKTSAAKGQGQEQVWGYNSTIRAPFVALIDQAGAKTMWIEKGTIVSIPFLPKYEELVGHTQSYF